MNSELNEKRHPLRKILWIVVNILFLGLPHFFYQVNKRLKLKITFKTTFLFTLLFSSVMAIFAVFLLVTVENYVYKNASDELRACMVPHNFVVEDDGSNALDFLPVDALIMLNGEIIYLTNEAELERLIDNMDATTYVIEGSRMYLASTQYIEHYKSQVTMVLVRSVQSQREFIKQLQVSTVLLMPFLAIIALSLGMLASQGMLMPIRKMTVTLKQITPKKLNTRLEPIDSQDELRELTDIVNEMLASLENSFNQQTEFVGNASHELRTPLAVIQGYSNLLARWGKNDEEALDEAVNAINKESVNMQVLVEKLLFLTKLGNRYELNYREFDLNELLKEVVKETQMIDSLHKIVFVGNDDSVLIEADRELLKQTLRIFIDNAIKYSPSGKQIEIGCLDKEGNIHILIKDYGVGISDTDLPHIFNRFYRCDKARGRSEGSTGLGLSIAKQIVELHNGEITVTSKVGKGSAFLIELPSKKGQLLFEN